MKSPRPVLQYPNDQLKKIAEPITDFGTQILRDTVKEMIATMRRLRGIGLAATQIGLHKQLAVIELKDGPLVLINPQISRCSKKLEEDEEGCLSVPTVFGMVPRYTELVLDAFDIDGKPYTAEAHGLFARVIQHEYDHLHGKLFLDRSTRLTTGLDRARALGIALTG